MAIVAMPLVKKMVLKQPSSTRAYGWIGIRICWSRIGNFGSDVATCWRDRLYCCTRWWRQKVALGLAWWGWWGWLWWSWKCRKEDLTGQRDILLKSPTSPELKNPLLSLYLPGPTSWWPFWCDNDDQGQDGNIQYSWIYQICWRMNILSFYLWHHLHGFSQIYCKFPAKCQHEDDDYDEDELLLVLASPIQLRDVHLQTTELSLPDGSHDYEYHDNSDAGYDYEYIIMIMMTYLPNQLSYDNESPLSSNNVWNIYLVKDRIENGQDSCKDWWCLKKIRTFKLSSSQSLFTLQLAA